ncbi:MAG TPA: HD-GYP domain-containing protein [Gaiellaceae bacterium]|nr:HD-GYP domain-containing protein [Gaiellaceae bacterium]
MAGSIASQHDMHGETGSRWGLRRRQSPDRADQTLEELRKSYELTVSALAAALELRDDQTGGHAKRVTDLALALARQVDPELAEVPQLRYGFLLHDIGKIGIPDAILLKAGPLTEDERAQLHLHPILGEQLVSTIPYLQGVARDVIAYHHERYDGTGYPWGLAAKKIPLAARIFAVCDAFDAITNDRPYQAAMSVDAAIADIERNAGSQFDPGIVELFVPLGLEAGVDTHQPMPALPDLSGIVRPA